MTYNYIPFLRFVTLSGSTVTKTFAARDHTDTWQQNQCQMQLKLQKTLQCAALHNIVQAQATLIAVFVLLSC